MNLAKKIMESFLQHLPTDAKEFSKVVLGIDPGASVTAESDTRLRVDCSDGSWITFGPDDEPPDTVH